jgi:hypothetical protein
LFCLLIAIPALAAPAKPAPEPDTPSAGLYRLAAFLSDGESVGALEAFDKSMRRYGAIAEYIEALAAQTEVLCSIEIVGDKEADDDASDVHHLDLDWYMVLKSRADSGPEERRRQHVAVTMQRFYRNNSARPGPKGAAVWRITSISPEQILAPITMK